MNSTLTRSQVSLWRAAIFAIFFICGLGFAAWASRLPAVKVALGIGDVEIGGLLFVTGAASIFGLSAANVVVARWGARRGMYGTLVTYVVGMFIAGWGVQVMTSMPVAIVGLALMGLGMSSTDVMMNVEAAAVEQVTGRTIMPLFHAFFSIGTVVGAGIGIGMAALEVGVGWHLWGTSVLMAITGFVGLRAVPDRDAPTDAGETTSRRDRMAAALAVWREPRIYAIGAIMLGMAFAEGSANDWLAIAMVDGHDQSEAMGAIALTVFSTAMTVFRIIGGPLVDWLGRVWTLRILAVLAGSGLALFILAPTVPLAFVGIALWGAGASLGFPLGMSAAADDPAKAAASVSAAATIGYVAFLAGPPLLGWISHQIGILATLWIIVGLIAVSGLMSGAARPIAGSKIGSGHH